MENNSVLTFKSKSKYIESNEEDSIEFLTNAKLTKKNDKYYVMFNYPDEYVTANQSKATLKIEKDKVTLLKYGKSCSQYIFEQGQQHNGQYELGFGTLSVGIFSDNVSVDVNENGGDINLNYRIYFNDLVTHSTNLSINLKKL